MPATDPSVNPACPLARLLHISIAKDQLVELPQWLAFLSQTSPVFVSVTVPLPLSVNLEFIVVVVVGCVVVVELTDVVVVVRTDPPFQ